MKTINSLRSKLLALTFALMASVSTFAYEFEYVNDFHVDGFAYKVLPPTMEAPFGNVALIEIADCTEDVVIPGTVTHEGVTYIVTTLGGGATLFTNSAKEIVKSVFIPKKISTINSPLFADCSNLTSIVVDSRNSYYDSCENCNAIITTSQNSFFTPNMLIAGCKTTTIPNSVTEIADKAFYRSAIESITIPTGVTKIGHSAFNQATLLSSIKLPITLTEIGDWAFADCLNLNTISCYALEPPTISSNTFFGSNPIYNNPSVYVPAYCIEAYKNAEHWKWFTQILPINEPAYKDRWCDTWNVLTIKRELETWQYNLAHDTIIGDYTYTAVTRHTTKVPAGVYPVMAPEPEYVAAVRFTEDKKAFIYYDNTEYLLYDFNAQPGDELTVFAGINHYRSHKTNRCGIGEVNIFPDSNYYYSREISLNVYPNYTGSIVPTCFGITKWIEGVGDICGLITGADCGLSDDQSALLCAYKDGNTEYTTEYEEYAEYGCEYNSGENKEYILTLPGLQRTEVEFHTDGASAPSLVSFNEYTPTLVNGKWYLYDGRNYLREENNQVLLYSPEFEIYEDVVLYDWTLEIGDTLPFTIRPFDDDKMRGAVFRVTDVSTITLLDGKEYKKWTLACGIEYIEGIGAINGEGFGNYFCIQHTAHPATYIDTRLVCASRNGQLLYQMDEAEMERLGTECLCEVETSYKSQWCDTWNVFVENGSVYPPYEETYRYQLAKDTVIGEHTYTAVVSKVINDALDAPHYVAAVRFTDDRKVYIYYDNAEYLLYDFNLQEGDELEVFAGINNYTSEIKTYKCTVTGVEQYACVGCPAAITLEVHNHPNDFREFYRQTQWIEGVGDINGFLNGLNGYINIPGNAEESLLCAYKGDELKYTGPLYEKYGCEYNANDPLPLYPWCNQWNILAHGYLGPQEPLYGAKTTIYQLGGDTIINHLRYQQLTRYASDDVNQTNTYVGAIRFTKNNRQVYFYYDNAEYLLYDFKAQVGDTLEVFAGIDNYKYHKTYKHVVTNKEPIEDEQTKVTLEVIVTEEFEGNIYEEKFITTWMEGVGSPDGIVHNHATQFAGSIITDLLCAYVDDRRMYRTNTKDPFGIDYTQLGCEYNNGDFIEGAFPILSGLQRTVYDEFCGEAEIGAVYTGKQTFDKIFFENDKPYILCNDYLLREEENKILIYSQILNKDLVLYDFTLEVGDSLPALYIDYQQHNAMDWMPYNIGVVDYNKYFDGTIYPADTFVVTDVSNVTLLDGKEYKKWTFDNGMEYVEGIGMYGGRRNGNFFGLIQDVVVPCHIGTHLVCASRNNKLLYQMDAAEMERLGAECLCDYDRGPRKDNAKDGQIGGRPTPTQWNQLELDLREMDNGTTILRAETFSYTLENDSIVANDKTFYLLARQSTKDTATTKSFVGALHFGKDEDNRVYFLRDGVEYVLYDFTAEPGDTIEIFAGINNYPQETTYTHVVVDKDTTEDGACRMFLEVVFPEETTTATNVEKVWLAGLGSIDGIVHNAASRASKARSSETQTSVMLCAWREDNCLYTTDHPDYDTFGCVYNQDPTALESPTSPSSYKKILREGQLLIMHDGKIYTIMGIEIK